MEMNEIYELRCQCGVKEGADTSSEEISPYGDTRQ